MRRYIPLAFFGVAVLSAVSIIYWGVTRGDDDDLFGQEDGTFLGLDASDGGRDDFLREFADHEARNAQEIRVVAADLLDWARDGAEDDDASLELVAVCDSVPPPPFHVIAILDEAPTTPETQSFEVAVGDICGQVNQGVVRRAAADWASLIDTQLPDGNYPYTDGGTAAVEAHVERLKVWSEHVLAARPVDADYIHRFCDRGSITGFGTVSSPPMADQDADRLANQMGEVCLALAESSAVGLAELIDSTFTP